MIATTVGTLQRIRQGCCHVLNAWTSKSVLTLIAFKCYVPRNHSATSLNGYSSEANIALDTATSLQYVKQFFTLIVKNGVDPLI